MATETTIQRDDEGYLVNPDAWTPKIAEEFAREEAIALTNEHWIVINLVREYYATHGITPDIRHMAKQLAELRECDKKEGKARLFGLFPYGYVRQACKIAGMKRPRAWSTG